MPGLTNLKNLLPQRPPRLEPRQRKMRVQTIGALGASNRQPYPLIREGRPIETLLHHEAMLW
jgi:hypothetical protein